jgi:hypothetical protein
MEPMVWILGPPCNSNQAAASIRVDDEAGSHPPRRTARDRYSHWVPPHDGSHREDTSSTLTTIRSDLIAFIEDAKETNSEPHKQAFIYIGAR